MAGCHLDVSSEPVSRVGGTELRRGAGFRIAKDFPDRTAPPGVQVERHTCRTTWTLAARSGVGLLSRRARSSNFPRVRLTWVSAYARRLPGLTVQGDPPSA